jgi:hypothetical protein
MELHLLIRWEAPMPEEYVLRLEASGEVTPARPDDDQPDAEEAEQ